MEPETQHWQQFIQSLTDRRQEIVRKANLPTTSQRCDMAFFKTAVDWVNYTDRYCSKCAHWKEYVEGQGNGCPVMDAHISFGCVDRPNGEVSEILDLLVPKDEKWAMVCRLYAEPGGSRATRPAW